jgi:hypothetical protein
LIDSAGFVGGFLPDFVARRETSSCLLVHELIDGIRRLRHGGFTADLMLTMAEAFSTIPAF